MNRDTDNLKIQRKHPRVEVDVSCMVGLSKGNLSAAHIRNLSEGGLKFSCNHHTAHGILPEDRRTPGTVRDIEVEIHFEVPGPDGKSTLFKCTALLIHCERLAQDSFLFGVQFLKTAETASKALTNYLDNLRIGSE